MKDIYGEKQYKRESKKMSDEELEPHAAESGKRLFWATPVFDGAFSLKTSTYAGKKGFADSGQIDLYDGRTGEMFDR